MKLGVVVPFYRRRALAGVVLRHLARVRDALAPDIELDLVGVASEPDDAAAVVEAGWRLVQAPNRPLAAKWTAGLAALRTPAAPDAVVISGSDDLLSAELFLAWRDRLGDPDHRTILGLLDCYVYRPVDRRLSLWPGYSGARGGETIGTGRCLSRGLLDALGWQPWGLAHDRGLDASMQARVRALHGGESVRVDAVTMAAAAPVLDVKHDPDGSASIGSWESMADASVPIDAAAVLDRFPPETVADLHAACDPVPTGPPLWTPCDAPVVSAAMIVRDEAAHLERCLRSIAAVVDEAVVVDTGSTDATREIAAALGCRVLEEPWRDDFSAARNTSLAACRGHWRVIIDGDEVLTETAGLENLRRVRPDQCDGAVLRVVAHGARTTIHDSLRVLGPSAKYEFPVHNVPRGVTRAARLNAVIETTYHGRIGAKAERSLRLLHAMVLDPRWPDHPHAPAYLASTYLAIGRYVEAHVWARTALERAGDSPDYASVWITLAMARLGLGDKDAVREAERALDDGIETHPGYAELRYTRMMLDGRAGFMASRRASPYDHLPSGARDVWPDFPEISNAMRFPLTFERAPAQRAEPRT